MSERTYPYKAWALMPSLTPVEVELVGPYSTYYPELYGHLDVTVKNKAYSTEHDLYPSKAEAIAAGRKKIDEQQADIAKRLERINKRIAALDKAEREY